MTGNFHDMISSNRRSSDSVLEKEKIPHTHTHSQQKHSNKQKFYGQVNRYVAF